MSSTIAVECLQVGMFIHLDRVWLSHPFALSSFRLSSPDQIAVIRGLGLGHVRWSPEKSDPPGAEGAPAVTEAAVLSPAERMAQRHRERLAAQRETQQQCERQFGEASQAWHEAYDVAATRPLESGEKAFGLARAMLNKLLLSNDVGIRLVAASSGDRAAAHALNVTVVALLLGRMLGLSGEDLLDLGTGSLMHDVGKCELPERVRHLESGATAAQINAYRDHVAQGLDLGRAMGLARGAVAIIAQHHEHSDGTGFPQHLAGERIGLASRIAALANRYDNLCNPPTCAPSLTPHEAVAMLFAQGRSLYDTTVLNGFIRMMGVYPAGSLVQLTDDRFAMVVGVNSMRPLRPRVLVHDPKIPCNEALLLDLEEAPDVGIRRSISAAKLPRPALDYLDPRPRVHYYFEPLAPVDDLRRPGEATSPTLR